MSNYLRRHDDFDLFDNEFFDNMFNARGTKNMLKTDIKENDKAYILDVDVPGIDKENIKISLEHGYLTINATKESSQEEKKNHKYLRQERFYGSCSRSFYVGDVDKEMINASFNNGVLTIEVPKENLNSEKAKYIAIK